MSVWFNTGRLGGREHGRCRGRQTLVVDPVVNRGRLRHARGVAVPGRDDTSRAHPRDVAGPQLAERDAVWAGFLARSRN